MSFWAWLVIVIGGFSAATIGTLVFMLIVSREIRKAERAEMITFDGVDLNKL